MNKQTNDKWARRWARACSRKNKVAPQNVTIEELENKISVKVTKTIRDEKYITSTRNEF